MGKIISLVNQKGGVGKTTTSINLSNSLGHLGKKTLLIDLDPQSNSTTGLGVDRVKISKSIYNVIMGDCKVEDAIIKTPYKNLSIIPALIDLAGVDIELIQIGVQDKEFRVTEQLKKALQEVRNRYDFIIIDCPPNLGILTTNALAASDSVLIPIQCEYYSLEGVNQLLHTILKIQNNVNPNLDIEGVLLTMLDGRTLIGLEVVEDVRKFFNEKVFSTIIPRLVKLVEAPSHGKPILEYDPKSNGALAYLNLAKEVIERNGK
ncbi:MAG: ParA family protein [Bacilli bacterium]|nr:ParA family protein [Bacilli bacterium]MBQ4263603.1 ParA family protein [Bacilli bacterium]